MELPKKISPDYIKEAVIEVRYTSQTSPEILLGIFYQAFDDSWYYTNRPNQSVTPSSIPSFVQELTIRVGTESLLYNDKINISLLQNSFVFTCFSNYIGWEDYIKEIEKALRIFESTTRIKQWTRIGVRYISEYPELDLQSIIKFNFSFGLPEIKSNSTSFKSEFTYKNCKVILNLKNHIPILVQNSATKNGEVVYYSISDIDVIADNLKIENVDELLIEIKECHNKEKELFFGIIQENFLKSLNPQY